MKKILFTLICLLLGGGLSQAQTPKLERLKTVRGQGVICPGEHVDHFVIVEARDFIRKARQARGAAEKKSNFVVTYNGFPEEAKVAFERAVEIWEHLLHSDVPIHVYADWQPLSNNVLGSANTSEFLMNFEGAPYVSTYYPMALAEKLAGKPLNADGVEDIYCRFNSTVTWHFGAPEEIPSGAFDFTTVVLHELGHGLGFVSTMGVAGQSGNYGFGTPYKSIYDLFVETESGNNLVDTTFFKNPSQALYQSLTSNALYFERSLGGERPKLYAPNPFSAGSSISHLDDQTYRSGSSLENLLMTSTSRTREVSHDPGPLALAAFYEMGWKGTSIVHQPLKNFPAGTTVTFKAKLLSDTTIKAGSTKLFYQAGGALQSIAMQQLPGTSEYSVQVLFPVNVQEVLYFIETEDNSGRKVRSPGTDGLNAQQYVYAFRLGDDVSAPIVWHSPLSIEEVSYPKVFRVLVEDDFHEGLASVQMNYQVNGGPTITVALDKFDPQVHGLEWSLGADDALLYILIDPIPGLKEGDLVRYQFVATDKSQNSTTVPVEFTSTQRSAPPVSSFFEFTVTRLLELRNSYATDFENAERDFATLGFTIGKQEGFPTSALHSTHPYRNGLGALDEEGRTVLHFDRNDVAMLRYPIRTGRGENTLLSFDEVVLVEPGETGAQYQGNDFYDYVVVEGSFDGAYWFPLEDGYDSRAHFLWESHFNSSSSGGDYPNSTAKGHVTQMRKRTMLINTAAMGAPAGQPLLIRFRLYSDQLSNGWGWAIDNLFIQENAPVILANEESTQKGITLYPIPATDYVDIRMVLSDPQKVRLEVFSLTGEKVHSEWISAEDVHLSHRLRVEVFPPGTYVIQIREARGAAFKRFTKL